MSLSIENIEVNFSRLKTPGCVEREQRVREEVWGMDEEGEKESRLGERTGCGMSED